MIIRGKLKDVILLPNEGNDYEYAEALRLTQAVRGDDNAQIIIKTEYNRGGEMVVRELKVIGIAAKESWQ